eukprot:1139895-Pelagomonas_calceolata.AAC.5
MECTGSLKDGVQVSPFHNIGIERCQNGIRPPVVVRGEKITHHVCHQSWPGPYGLPQPPHCRLQSLHINYMPIWYKGKRPQSRRLTASLFINTHEVMKQKGRQGILWETWRCRKEKLPIWHKKGGALAQKSRESPPPQSYKTDIAKRDLLGRVTGSTRLQNLAVKSIIVFNSTPRGNKLVGVYNRMGMQFASKSNGTPVVKSQLFKLVQGMLNTAGPTNNQEDGAESHNFSTTEFAEVCMLPLFRLKLLSRYRVFTVLDFK